MIVNAAIWGFIDAAVSGSADTLFMGADRLNGLDGWRRVTRYISHGKKVYQETLRREMKVIVDRPISSMERLEEGIAEFENAIKLYEDAGGEVYSDDAKKMDLLKILPGDLGESLISKAAEPGGFVALKDHIITMMGRILQVKKKLPLHNVDHGYGPGVHDPRMPPLGASAREEEMEDADEFLAALAQCQDGHEQLAVINRWKSSKAGNGRYQPRNPAGQRGERRERSSPAPRGATD